MSKQNREKTHKELIQIMARKLGSYHKPAIYIKAIKDEYGIEVTNSSLTKSLGSFWSRLRTDESQLLEIGKTLLRACHNDRGLAGSTFDRRGCFLLIENFFANQIGLCKNKDLEGWPLPALEKIKARGCMKTPTCADCKSEMEPGFIPNSGGNGDFINCWYPGQPKGKKWFGRPSGVLKLDVLSGKPIMVFRCKDCHQLKLFASPVTGFDEAGHFLWETPAEP